MSRHTATYASSHDMKVPDVQQHAVNRKSGAASMPARYGPSCDWHMKESVDAFHVMDDLSP